MAFLIAPAIAGGFLGVLAYRAGGEQPYLERVQWMLLGAATLGYLGVAAFVWRRTTGWRRWGILLMGLAGMRVLYVPVLALALLLLGWLEHLAGAATGRNPGGALLHYGLGCFVAAWSSLGTLLLVAALADPRRPRSVAAFLIFACAAALTFGSEADRRVSPHPIDGAAPALAAEGPGYFQAASDPDLPLRARVLAAASGVRHALGSATGWHGAIRDDLLGRFRGRPDLSLRDRVAALEAALAQARRGP